MIEDAALRKPTQIAQQEVLQNLVQFTIPEDESKD
jgi:DNA-directed RNA polymerase subunit K/omega